MDWPVLFQRIARLVTGQRLAAGLLLLVVVGSLAGGAASLRPDFALSSFFGGDDPARDAYDDYKRFWGNDDGTVVVVVSAEEGTLLTAPRIGRLRKVADELLEAEHVEDVDNLATVTWMRGGGGTLKLDPVSDTVPDPEWGATAEDLDAWRRALLANPLFVPGLLSADGRVAAMLVKLRGETDDVATVVPLVKALRASLAAHEGQDGLHFVEAGIPVVRTDFFDAILRDQMVFFPVIGLLMVLTLGLTLRRLHGVLVPGVAAMVPTLMVLGLMGYAGAPIDLVSQTLITLLPAIAVADAIHLVGRFHEEARRLAPAGERLSPVVRREAIVRALRAIGAACLMTSLTTAMGFGSLMVARMPILRDFGMYAALGVAFAYASVLVIVPLMLSFTRGGVPDLGREGAYTATDRFLLATARLGTRRPWHVLAATAVLTAVFGWLGSRVVVDNNLSAILDDAHRTSAANRLADAELGGILTLDVDVVGEPDALRDPRVLEAMLRLEDEVKGWPEIRSVTSPATLVAEAMRLLDGARRIPPEPSGVAQILLLLEGDPGLKELLSFDRHRGRLVLRAKDQGGIAFEALTDRLQPRVDAAFVGLPVTATLTGTAHVAYRGINNVARDLVQSLVLAFVLIALAVLALFRDLRMVAVALVPTALPLVFGYGLLALLGWDLDPSVGLIFTVALGIAIDDSIHVLARFREERARGHGVVAAAGDAVLHSGRAVAITSLLITIGLGINVFSSFPAMSVMGWLGAFTMAVALACDALVLPALLVLVSPTAPGPADA